MIAVKRAASIEYAQSWGFEDVNAWTTRDEECTGGTDAILAISLLRQLPFALFSLSPAWDYSALATFVEKRFKDIKA